MDGPDHRRIRPIAARAARASGTGGPPGRPYWQLFDSAYSLVHPVGGRGGPFERGREWGVSPWETRDEPGAFGL